MTKEQQRQFDEMRGWINALRNDVATLKKRIGDMETKTHAE